MYLSKSDRKLYSYLKEALESADPIFIEVVYQKYTEVIQLGWASKERDIARKNLYKMVSDRIPFTWEEEWALMYEPGWLLNFIGEILLHRR